MGKTLVRNRQNLYDMLSVRSSEEIENVYPHRRGTKEVRDIYKGNTYP